ncbi:MAG: nitronate monooxygenase family protein [Myxococcota bacterium]|nr:monooxygenase [Deltaproteobacteria bacterium]MCP4245247.1 nitronate monooxygenase [bacterium]MDP6073991.1 nitronate monooxygenase family protein [Myxococcota bacterium]MDP6241824.1 nitronate monooxygenase family protein [Myxococcota bacterium]MDP7074537.1 nitronate monooxygenase family protein [Myxococcota bacterium]
MQTKLAEELGIEFPIFAFTHCRDVAAAVTNAGGLGVLGVAGHSAKNLAMELEWIENEVDGKPFGVDLLLPARFAGSDRGGFDATQMDELIPAEHRKFVDELLAQHEVPSLPSDVTPSFGFAVGYERQREVIELVFQHPISLIASALGPPPPWMVEQGREHGVKVAALAGTVEHAQRHAEAGVDIVVAQGYEAGGHTGTVSTLVLVPEVVDAVSPIPVLAAGGIGNGRQLTAALALGAQGVWTGSVWLTTEEAETHPVVKEKFLKALSVDTVRSRSLTGKPARQLRSAWTDAWEDPENPDPLPMPLQPRLVSGAQERINRTAHNNPGAEQLVNYFVGQIVGSLNHVKSVRAVMEEFAVEYADTMEHLDALAEGADS